MKIMGVGNASREHAIAEILERSKHRPRVFWLGDVRNPGIFEICKRTGGDFALSKTTDPEKVSEYAKKWHVDFVIIGPEEPNFHAVPDELERRGIPCVGASRDVAMIEMSKAEMRRLQWEYGVRGKLLFKTFRSAQEAYSVLERYSDTLTWLQNVALKPARQAGGKGVKVVEDQQLYLHDEKQRFKSKHADWLEGYMKSYSDIDDKILVEEKVWGPEYTLQCFTDGHCIKGMPLVQDNKHAHEFDIGTETGGMGSISGPEFTLPFITKEEYEGSLEIVESLVQAIQDKVGKSYHGMVAGQMMLTEIEGPTIIEMYSRLGDPEALNVLNTLKTDFVDICLAILDGNLSKLNIEFDEKATVVKAIAPKGYPDNRGLAKNHPVFVDEEAIKREGCKFYWGSADLREGEEIESAGSRLVEILAISDEIEKASKTVDRCIPYVRLLDGWGLFYRSDIGSPELLSKRMDVADRVRMLYQYRRDRDILGKRVDWLPKVGRMDPVALLRDELSKKGE
ncbi:MAG: phosphoribosylamine--glycine ligase [Candidatus Methylarchaceae archaeon HK02M1]|nr:phosphoribosylamine--glycine ligase [Candidatus Methylarchaceae archaeon HK02M1]